jgi:hypothetical protein
MAILAYSDLKQIVINFFLMNIILLTFLVRTC